MTRYKEAIELLNARQTPPAIVKASLPQYKSSAPERSLWPFLKRLNLDHFVKRPGLFIHIAGSKGKGSTCGFVAAIINKHRIKYGKPGKIGLYTSPHVTAVRERIQINSKSLTEEKFAQYYFEVHEKLDDTTKPTYFRFLTLMAMYVFEKEDIDVGVIEVGVGGTNDATNVLAEPAITAITSLGFDHVKQLGNNIADIAGHKAGIIKQGRPCFTVPQEYETALNVLRLVSEQKEADLKVIDYEKEFSYLKETNLPGFQKTNAALSIAIARCFLRESKLTGNIYLSKEEELEAICAAQPLGRGQIVTMKHLKLFIDGAHSQESLRAAVLWYSMNTIDQFPRALIYSHDSFRDLKILIEALYNALDTNKALPAYIVFCGNKVKENEPNSFDLTHVSRTSCEESNKMHWESLMRDGGIEQVHCAQSVERALELISSSSNSDMTQVLVTGSLKLTGAINTLLQES